MGTMVAVPLKNNDLIGSLGQSAEVIGAQVGQLSERSLDGLKRLGSAYSAPAASLSKFEAAADRASDLPPFGHNPGPWAAFSSLQPIVKGTYYAPSVARHETAGDPFPALLDKHTRRKQIVAMAIMQREDVRTAVERMAVGKVVMDERNDGTVTIQTEGKPTGSGVHTSAMAAQRAEEMASNMPPEVLAQFAQIQLSQAAFGPFGLFTSGMSGGFADTLGISDSASSDDPTSSLDIGVLKLKRQLDKRSHAMELYSGTLTAYNNSAKGIIEKMRA